MKPILAMFTLLLWVAGFAFPSPSLAQQSMGNMGNMGGMRGSYSRLYDPHTVVTVTGEVVSVEKVAYRSGRSYGIHLLLKTADEEIPVHLGPSWFMARHGMKIAPHDTIEVTGSRVTYGGKPAIIAAEVTRGSEKLVLRDSNGYPKWSRSRRR